MADMLHKLQGFLHVHDQLLKKNTSKSDFLRNFSSEFPASFPRYRNRPDQPRRRLKSPIFRGYPVLDSALDELEKGPPWGRYTKQTHSLRSGAWTGFWSCYYHLGL